MHPILTQGSFPPRSTEWPTDAASAVGGPMNVDIDTAGMNGAAGSFTAILEDTAKRSAKEMNAAPHDAEVSIELPLDKAGEKEVTETLPISTKEAKETEARSYTQSVVNDASVLPMVNLTGATGEKTNARSIAQNVNVKISASFTHLHALRDQHFIPPPQTGALTTSPAAPMTPEIRNPPSRPDGGAPIGLTQSQTTKLRLEKVPSPLVAAHGYPEAPSADASLGRYIVIDDSTHPEAAKFFPEISQDRSAPTAERMPKSASVAEMPKPTISLSTSGATGTAQPDEVVRIAHAPIETPVWSRRSAHQPVVTSDSAIRQSVADTSARPALLPQNAPPSASGQSQGALRIAPVEPMTGVVEGSAMSGLRADITQPVPVQQGQPVHATAPIPLHVGRQIAEALQHMPNRPVEITLSPEELGRVRLAMSTTETGISVSVLAERPETMDMMRRHISTLETAFQEIGYSEIAFSFSDSGQSAGEKDDLDSAAQASGNQAHTDDMVSGTARIDLTNAPTGCLDIRL